MLNPMFNPTCMSYWYPKLEALTVPEDKKLQKPEKRIPMPKTELIDAGEDWHVMVGITDNPERFPKEFEAADKTIQDVADRLMMASTRLGDPPFFLRTGLTSGKHEWNKCCFLPDRFAKTFYDHVVNLVYDSVSKDLDCRHWAVREYLPVQPMFVCNGYGGFPFVPEVRAFTKGGKIRGYQPYWPAKALEDGKPNSDGWESFHKQAKVIVDRAWENPDSGLKDIIQRVMEGLPGYDWSIDLLLTTKGWYVTDLAEAGRSHFEKDDFKFEEGMS